MTSKPTVIPPRPHMRGGGTVPTHFERQAAMEPHWFVAPMPAHREPPMSLPPDICTRCGCFWDHTVHKVPRNPSPAA